MRLLVLGIALLLPNAAFADSWVLDFSQGPVVFDFEDGLQGWEVRTDTTERVGTDRLGGDWAVRVHETTLVGATFASVGGLYHQIDLSNVGAIEVALVGRGFLVALVDLELIENVFVGKTIPFNPPQSEFAPTTARISLAPADRTRLGAIGLVGCVFPDDVNCELSPGMDFDDITFFPVPEPSPAVLVLGAAGLARCSRPGKRRRRAPDRAGES